VRVLDVVQAPFDRQIELLRAFGQLDEGWHRPLADACDVLMESRRIKRTEAARVIARMLGEMLTLVEVTDIGKHDDAAPHLAPLESRYLGRQRQIERRARADVETIYGHQRLERRETDFDLLDQDLLSREVWLAFGLKRRDLIAVGAAGGAVVGGVADAAFMGSSFLTGTLIGAAVGGALGYFTSDRLADVKVLRQRLGGQRLRYGPTTNVNFPFVVLGRARLHHDLVAGRTHAQRGVLMVDPDSRAPGAMNPLSDDRRRQLGRLFHRLRRAGTGEGRQIAVSELAAGIDDLLAESENSTEAASPA
jgi:hypothetical protein